MAKPGSKYVSDAPISNVGVTENECVCGLQDLLRILDRGHKLPFPDGILINGRGSGATFNVQQGQDHLSLYQDITTCLDIE